MEEKRDRALEVINAYKEIYRIGDISYTLDESLFDYPIEKEQFEGMDVYFINRQNNKSNKIMFFLHGGYYVFHAGNDPLIMLNKIIKRTDMMLVFPIYTLAPFHSVTENYDRMVRLYNKVRNENPTAKICGCGESAGGGFVTALALGLDKQPDELLLLSPWVDVEMNNKDLAPYIETDPNLSVEMAVRCGKEWAKEVPTSDWHVSPINGDISKLKNVAVFVGELELFYPDNTLFYKKLVEAGCPNCTLVVGKESYHVYPPAPTLEAQKAVDIMVDLINR